MKKKKKKKRRRRNKKKKKRELGGSVGRKRDLAVSYRSP